MKTICPGCGGKRWVDSQYKGAQLCPVCKGAGELSDTLELDIPTIPNRKPNRNPLLQQLEKWLNQQKGITFAHSSETMNTYNFISKTKERQMGLVWVATNGQGRIDLFKGGDDCYKSVDPLNKVEYKKVWGGYPHFQVRTQTDVDYAKGLILYALSNF